MSVQQWVNPSHWAYHGTVVDLEEPIETCQLCGQQDLRYHFQIVHLGDGTTLWVGSECIKKFQIKVIVEGRVLDRPGAAKQVDRDRRSIEKQAQTRSVLNSLLELAAVDPAFAIDDFIEYYSQRGAFTPKQMGLLRWRFDATNVSHNPRHFKVILKRHREQQQLRDMEDWKREALRPYLSSSQRQRWLE